MNDVVDVVVTNGEPLTVVASEELPLDLLNRQGVVDRIIQLLNIISNNHSSCSFALIENKKKKDPRMISIKACL